MLHSDCHFAPARDFGYGETEFIVGEAGMEGADLAARRELEYGFCKASFELADKRRRWHMDRRRADPLLSRHY